MSSIWDKEPKPWDALIMNKIEPTMSDTFDPYDWDDTGDEEEEETVDYSLASDTQVGGDHYTKLAIQPMTYSMANELNALQHTAIKYVTRYQNKGTPLQDLAKARHCIDMLVEEWMEREG